MDVFEFITIVSFALTCFEVGYIFGKRDYKK